VGMARVRRNIAVLAGRRNRSRAVRRRLRIRRSRFSRLPILAPRQQGKNGRGTRSARNGPCPRRRKSFCLPTFADQSWMPSFARNAPGVRRRWNRSADQSRNRESRSYASDSLRNRGQSIWDTAPIDEIEEYAASNHIAVIDDAAQALGARRCGRLAGTFGNCGIVSCGAGKPLAGAAGGRSSRIRANFTDVRRRSRCLRNRALTRSHDSLLSGWNGDGEDLRCHFCWSEIAAEATLMRSPINPAECPMPTPQSP